MTMPPLVRLEVEEMKASILHYMSKYHSDVEEQVAAQIEAAIENYDFAGRVSEAVRSVINDAIRGYFEYGPGREAIRDAVWKAMETIVPRKDEENNG